MLQLCNIVSCHLFASARQHAAGKGKFTLKSPVVNRLQLLKVLKAAMVLYMLTWFEAHACIAERVSASCFQD